MGKDEDKKNASYVFINDPDFGWRPAVMESKTEDHAIVKIPEYKNETAMICDGGRGGKMGDPVKINLKDYAHKVLPLQNVDSNGSLIEFADMVKLPYLHEVCLEKQVG
jgi:hypothetical protein